MDYTKLDDYYKNTTIPTLRKQAEVEFNGTDNFLIKRLNLVPMRYTYRVEKMVTALQELLKQEESKRKAIEEPLRDELSKLRNRINELEQELQQTLLRSNRRYQEILAEKEVTLGVEDKILSLEQQLAERDHKIQSLEYENEQIRNVLQYWYELYIRQITETT